MYVKYAKVWSEARSKYGAKVALLFQVGGFFELYATENLTTGEATTNVREIAEICQLSLTTHIVEGSPHLQTLFGGFPEHAIGKFERVLVGAGYTVVVVVQRKGASGAVEERVVEHISSPGCYVDSVRERRLVGVVLESLTGGPTALRRVYWAAAALDIATGRIWFVEGSDRDRLHQFLCCHPPAEILLWSDGLPAANEVADQLRGACGAVHMRCLGAANAAVEKAALERFWTVARLEWLPRLPQARRCLAGLMEFAEEHVPSALKALGLPEAWIPDGEVRLGNAALEQLGLLTLREGAASGGLLGLMDQCRSVAGRRLMRARLMRPISDIVELTRRLDAVDAAAGATEPVAVGTERCLRSLYDMSRLWRRAELGTLGLNEAACLLRSYDAARELMGLWPGGPTGVAEFLDWVAARWDTVATAELARRGESLPISALPFVAGAAPELESAFAVGLAMRGEAADLCRLWSGLGRGETLYLDDAEGGGFRCTGTKRRISAVVAALRDEGDTTAKMTPFKTSALVETAGMDALSARHRAWTTGWVATWATGWSTAVAELVERGREAHAALEAWCAELDLSWTVARLARDWLWKRPEFVADAEEAWVAAEKLRHPILERITTGPYVAHTVGLGSTVGSGPAAAEANRGMLLYGMNASGKSSLMKALGIAVLLAQCGFPVPAAKLRLSPFTAIMTRILGNDNLWAGLSSFAVEMTEFREILRYADARSLVLGDELCAGTESLSATALVAAGVESLVARGTKFVFATHLHELATMSDLAALAGLRSFHLRVHYDAAADRLVYDRELAPGSGSALYGLEVCRALDLPDGFLARATALRKQLSGWKEPHASSYSAGAVVDACAVCGGGAALEMHHIRPQADAAAAAAEGVDIHAPGNLVCLCGACHDDHHAGRLVIAGWKETSAGRKLEWSRSASGAAPLPDEVVAWIREQRTRRARIPTIQRMVQQIYGVAVSERQIRGLR
jgi:DNA mismatch repair protein MutS